MTIFIAISSPSSIDPHEVTGCLCMAGSAPQGPGFPKQEPSVNAITVFSVISYSSSQLVPKSTRTLVTSYPFLVNSYLTFGQLVPTPSTYPKSTRT